jgi:hypothetical protein
VVWTTLPIAGAHGRGGHKDGPGRVQVFDFATGETKTLAAQADSFVLAPMVTACCCATAPGLRAISATRKPEDKLGAR